MNFRYDPANEKLIVSKSTRIEYHQINIWLDRFVKGYRFTPTFKMGIWNGKKDYFNNGSINMGLWKECFNACQEIGTTFKIDNKEDFPINREITIDSVTEFCKEFFKDHKVKTKEGEWVPFMPYDYQIETAYKVLKNRYCITEVATSGGKSLIISIVFFYILSKLNPDAKLLIIVPSISLVTQFYANIEEYYHGSNNVDMLSDYNIEVESEDGTIQLFNPKDMVQGKKGMIKADLLKEKDGYKRVSRIIIDRDVRMQEIMSDKPRSYHNNPNIFLGTYQSLEKYPQEFFDDLYGVVVDEAHTCKAKTLSTILEKTFKKAEYRFGVSGTFPNDDSCEILTIQSLLGPKVSQIEASTLVASGNITPMQIYSVIMNHNEKGLFAKLRAARGPNNGAQIYQYEKKFVQESEKRLEFIKKLVETKCKNNTMILFHTIEYGKKILSKIKEIPDIDVYYIDGEVNNKERKIIIEEMNKTDRIKILVSSYGTTGTGLSINSIFNVILADSFKSEQLIIQSIGRSLRKFAGKITASIYDLVDILDPKNMTNVLYRHYEERESFYVKRKYPFKVIKINL